MMFEVAEVGHRIDEETYQREAPLVRAGLLDAQRHLAASNLAVIVIVGGAEGADKEDTVHLLLDWMDARGVEIHARWDPTQDERERPRYWRFWRDLPARGKMAIFFGSWYTVPIVDRVFNRINNAALESEMRRVVEFERMLSQEQVVLVKFWLHLSKRAQSKRLEAVAKDPRLRWRLRNEMWQFFKKYKKFRRVSEKALRTTSTGFAPWHIVEATDERYRKLTVATTLLRTLEEAVRESRRAADRPALAPVLPEPRDHSIIRRLDLTQRLSRKAYRQARDKWQGRLSRLTRRMHDAGRSMTLVFEGPDAAGKGGAIRRLTAAIDVRLLRVTSVSAPSDEELAHPYLWRFWRPLPRRGRITIYDRSWYGRVLVERIEGFCAPEDWRRAYAEINGFEEQLVESGAIVLKFWLAIDSDEQLARFKERQETPYKQYKITQEDWRNRKKWDAYEAAACDMIERTSTADAPWCLVEANDKRFARIKVLQTVCRRLRDALGD